MKKIIFFLTLSFIITTSVAQDSSFKQQWKKVENFELKNLPKSALAEVDLIYKKAKNQHNDTQIIKSLIYKSKFYLELEDDDQLKIISSFKKEIGQTEIPTKNILESILADLYWQYFQQNRYKFYDRTKTNKKVDSIDFRTWDLQTLFEEVHQHYQNSLKNKTILQKLEIGKFSSILINKENSKKYRPTLFDFLAHRAIDFYKSNERNIQNPTYKFTIDDPALLKNNEIFIHADLDKKDSLSQQLNAIYLYKDLTTFHLNDSTPIALIDITIERLNFIKTNAVFDKKQDIYLKTLLDLEKKYKSHTASAEISFKIAFLYNNIADTFNPLQNTEPQFKRAEALSICKKTIQNFPGSKGAEDCRGLINDINIESLSISIEQYIPINTPSRLLIRYRNITSMNFRVFKVSASQKNKYNTFKGDLSKIAFLKSLKADKQWSATLKNEKDYQEHSTEVLFPALDHGNYLVVAFKSDSLNKDKLYAVNFVQITDISIIKLNNTDKNVFQIINRLNGKPLQKAKVQVTNYSSYSSKKKLHNFTLYSDKNGLIDFYIDLNYQKTDFKITFKNDFALFGDYYFYNRKTNNTKNKLIAKSFMFTDRSIYRPGQTVYFKGILIQTENNKSQIIANENVAVTLFNVNDEPIKTLNFTTNIFGSFNGEFILPSMGLNGRYSIKINKGNENSNFYNEITDFQISQTYISVEEYKRPKFETKFKPIKETFRLNDSITVTGEATSFSESKISNAQVKYRVVRTASIPQIYWRYHYPNKTNPQEISKGKVTTNALGEYKIAFKAIPDLKQNKNQHPVFNYKIYADVTDINGETHHTETTVRVAYHSLEIEITTTKSMDKSLANNKINISTKNLNGEFVPTNGILKVYKLKSPKTVLRKRPWSAPDYPGFTEEEFHELFPHDAYKNENEEKYQDKGWIVFEKEINTADSKDIYFKNIKNWQSGKYIATFNCTDQFGQKVKKEDLFTVFTSMGNDIPRDRFLQVTTSQPTYQSSENAVINFSTAAQDLYVTVLIEKDHKTIDKKVLHLNNENKTISIPVKKEDIGGFAIFYHTAFHNSFEGAKININVPYPDEDLQIITKTFRDKIQPGSNQQWSFSIEGSKKDKVMAEVLASMYDMSLDQFKVHNWNFNPVVKTVYNSVNSIISYNSFKTTRLHVRNLRYSYFRPIVQQYDQLDWFGFSINNNRWVKNRYLRSIVTKYTKPKISSKIIKNKEKGYIYGIVSDESGVLPGVSVLINGTSHGISTDFDGVFKIKAKKGDELVFSFIGMQIMNVIVGKENFYAIEMTVDNNTLDEVIITARGMKSKNGMLPPPGAELMVIEEEVVSSAPVLSSPSAAKKLLIKGKLILKDNEKALIIIDGIPIINKDDLTINEKDILRIQILKGLKAISLYGEKAKNGVILITTKSGQKKLSRELNKIKVRTDFKETAFFFPNITTDKDGNFSFSFTIPESVTKWKLQLLAHTKDLRTGYKQLNTITQKDLMVVPNLPRFLRENDTIIINTKITNLSKEKLNGIAQIKFTDALSGKDITQQLLESSQEQNKNFSTDTKNSTTVLWKVFIPKNLQAIQYRIVAKAGDYSDGEQNILPILSNRMLVTETMTMQAKGNEKKMFTLEKCKNNTSKTLTNHKLTLEITSNPVWYAIQAIPYLMEFPHECSEQIFSRYYANTLAAYLVNSNPKIESVFKQWVSSDALISNLEKNPKLKSIIIQETPWLRDAQSETEQKKRLALLFDLNKMKDEQEKALDKLKQMQRLDGGFPWFSGGRYANRNITQHITIGLGKLNKIIEKDYELSTKNYTGLLKKSVSFLDHEILDDYQKLLEKAKEIGEKDGKAKQAEYLKRNHTGDFQIQYLYMRSFFKNIPLDKKYKVAVDYYRKQSYTYWIDYKLYNRGLITVAAKVNDDQKIANEIYRSLNEKSITNDEMGMYWKENQPSWYWYQSPVQTQSLMIEVFHEMRAEDNTMDNLKLWLLKNKQTNSWKTTKATTNAIYAILSTGSNWTNENELVKVKVGNNIIDPVKLGNTKIEAGTGYFKTSWNTAEIKPEMAEITLEKNSKGVAFGGLYWQYFEDLDKITSAKTGIQIRKGLFLNKNTEEGVKLYKIDDKTILKLGDLITVRIEIRSDRKMEFIHLKDMRASGFEPVNTISTYKYQDNLYYYESTKDASTNFFIDRLPKGVFVFEYDLRVNNAGNFSNGITTIQSMYAPEFSSHSKGFRVNIQ